MTPAATLLVRALSRLLDYYQEAVQARKDACVAEFRGYALVVFDHLIRTVPTVRIERRQIAPMVRPNAGPDWVRYPRNLNLILLNYARANKLKVRAHHIRISRRGKKPSRRIEPIPRAYDWQWTREDFANRVVRAQWWEADLASRYEKDVTSKIRRAMRTVAMAKQYLADVEQVQEPVLDIDHAEGWVRERLGWTPTAPEWPAAAAPRPSIDLPDPVESEDPKVARLQTAAALLQLAGSRLALCTEEYPRAAAEMCRRLSADCPWPLPEPCLIPVMEKPDPVEEPILIWHDRASSRHKLRPLRWTSRTALRAYRAYAATERARGRDPLHAEHYMFVTQIRRPQRDFAVTSDWERHFAHFYETHIISPLRHQWVRIWQIKWLTMAMADPSSFVMHFDPDDYLPNAPEPSGLQDPGRFW